MNFPAAQFLIAIKHFRLLHGMLILCVSAVFSTEAIADGDIKTTQPLATCVTKHYVAQAHTRYQDAIKAAEELLKKVNAFLAEPSPQTHGSVKESWIKAHEIYSHCEVFRFGNPNVDAWEGKVNAWPMDEGLIDYVAEGYIFHEGNPHARKNIVANGNLPITDDLIAEYQSGADPKAAPISSITDIESNVATGFHAIEFLLWGQDLNRNKTDCGQRPYTDFVIGDQGTGGHQIRRRDYLSAATRLLIRDLRLMTVDWDPENGLYTKVFLQLPIKQQLDRILLGLGSLGYAEVATERMKVALLTNDQEEEQSCFSDTTHRAIYQNIRSIKLLYEGHLHGDTQPKPKSSDSVTSFSALVQKLDSNLDRELMDRMDESIELARLIYEAGERGQTFDQLILADNEKGKKWILALMELLKKQTESFENVLSKTEELANLK